MNLTEHFTIEELTHTDHRTLDNSPNDTEIANLSTNLSQKFGITLDAIN